MTDAKWTWGDFLSEAKTALEPFDPDYVTLCPSTDPDESAQVWTDQTWWIACYAVEGGSEGWYVHVDWIGLDRSREIRMLAKFWSLDQALEASNALTRIVLPQIWGWS